MRKIDLSSVNWHDGMLVSQRDLLAQEDYHDQALVWLQRNGVPLYGLIPPRPGDHPALEIATNLASGNLLRVEVLCCRALTRDGSVIAVAPGDSGLGADPLAATREISSGRRVIIPVYIRVTGGKRAVGEPGLTGHGPRRLPEYELVLDEAKVADDGSALKVADLVVADFQAAADESFIPACLTVGAHPEIARLSGQTAAIARETLDLCAKNLGSAEVGLEAHPWQLAVHRALAMMVAGWAAGLDSLQGWEGISPPAFLAGVKAWFRVFGAAMASFPEVRETLDQKILQAGGLPELAGGAGFHQALTRFIDAPYVHEALGPQLKEARDHAAVIQESMRRLGEEMDKGRGEPVAAPRPKVTYRQQDYYQLDVGDMDHSFTEETQVLYFRKLPTRAVRSVLFVLRNNAPPGANERDIRLKGGVNEDRPLFCPDLAPDFKERPGQIYLLMEVEPGKRDAVDYFSLRSSGLVDFRELLQNKDTDVRVYHQ